MIRFNHILLRIFAVIVLAAVIGSASRTQPFVVSEACARTLSDPILEAALTASQAEMVAPGDITLTFAIQNNSAFDAQNVYLSSADGLLSEPIGQIESGNVLTFNRPHSVSAQELDEGIVSYIVSHDDPENPENKINYTLSAAITRGQAAPQVEFTRQFSSRYVTAGNTLTVTYRIRNTGNISLNSLRVRDTLGDFTGRIEHLDVGETRTLISRVTVNEACVSSASLSYSADSIAGDPLTQTLADVHIRLAQAQIDARLTAAHAAFSQNTAEVLLTLVNSGNIGYSDICITDDIYGGVIADGLRIDSGAAPLEISASYALRSSEGFRWRISGVSDAGERIDFVTETVHLGVEDVDHFEDLKLGAQALTPVIDRSGRVRVQIAIENTSRNDMRDVVLSESSLGHIYTFAVIPANSTTQREISIDVAQDSNFQFRLDYTDDDGWKRESVSGSVTVEISPDGVVPEGAKTGFIEFTGHSIKIGGSSLFAVLLITSSAILLALIVALIVATRRARFEKKLRIAAEKRRRREEMGKTTRFTPVKQNKDKE